MKIRIILNSNLNLGRTKFRSILNLVLEIVKAHYARIVGIIVAAAHALRPAGRYGRYGAAYA